MKPSRRSRIAVCIFLVSMGWLLHPGATLAYDVGNIQIQVSPNVLNMGSKGEVVTVHTDIPYSVVTGASVYLNGVSISWWKSDDRGFFVAKFDIDKVKYQAGLKIGENTVTLSGLTTDGVFFIGQQTLKVVDR